VLCSQGALAPGDLVVFTKGDFEGIAGGTNTMQILMVPDTPQP
jgi:pyruvate kinase